MNYYTHHFKTSLLCITLLSYMTASSTGKVCQTKQVGNNGGSNINSNKDVKNGTDTEPFSFGNYHITDGKGIPYRCYTGYLEVCSWGKVGQTDTCQWSPAIPSDLDKWKQAQKESAESWEEAAKDFEKMNSLETMREFRNKAKHCRWMGENCKAKS
jgi:hypothetical protein